MSEETIEQVEQLTPEAAAESLHTQWMQAGMARNKHAVEQDRRRASLEEQLRLAIRENDRDLYEATREKLAVLDDSRANQVWYSEWETLNKSANRLENELSIALDVYRDKLFALTKEISRVYRERALGGLLAMCGGDVVAAEKLANHLGIQNKGEILHGLLISNRALKLDRQFPELQKLRDAIVAEAVKLELSVDEPVSQVAD